MRNGPEDWWNKGYESHLSVLHQNDVKRKFAYHGSYIPENRDYLVPKEFLDKIKLARDFDDTINSSALNNYLLSSDTYGTANNLRNSMAETISNMHDMTQYIPFTPSHHVNDFRRMTGGLGGERFPDDQRRCWWKLHKFHLCLMAHTNEVNPLW